MNRPTAQHLVARSEEPPGANPGLPSTATRSCLHALGARFSTQDRQVREQWLENRSSSVGHLTVFSSDCGAPGAKSSATSDCLPRLRRLDPKGSSVPASSATASRGNSYGVQTEPSQHRLHGASLQPKVSCRPCRNRCFATVDFSMYIEHLQPHRKPLGAEDWSDIGFSVSPCVSQNNESLRDTRSKQSSASTSTGARAAP